MNIGLVAGITSTVPTYGHGASERLILSLAEHLDSWGHKVIIYCSKNSETLYKSSNCVVHSIPFDSSEWQMSEIIHVSNAYFTALQDKIDIIHNHTRSGLVMHYQCEIPIIHTLHSVTDFGDPPYYNFIHGIKAESLVLVSKNQVEILGHPENVNCIYNSSDFPRHNNSRHRQDYLLFVGRICENKGTHIAIESARATNHKLLIAGEVFLGDLTYFREKIEPELDDQIEYIGPIDGKEKISIFQKAKALLMPIQWEEPFGIVVLESITSGTPVIAFRRGAMAELIKDGINGFLVDNLDEMIKKIHEVDHIDADSCVATLKDDFTTLTMSRQYLSAYNRILGIR